MVTWSGSSTLYSRPSATEGGADCSRAAQRQASYLNESDTRARYATTLPSSTFMSSCETSATRSSRSVLAAVSTADLAACSQDTGLVPMISVMRYTVACCFLLAMTHLRG